MTPCHTWGGAIIGEAQGENEEKRGTRWIGRGWPEKTMDGKLRVGGWFPKGGGYGEQHLLISGVGALRCPWGGSEMVLGVWPARRWQQRARKGSGLMFPGSG